MDEDLEALKALKELRTQHRNALSVTVMILAMAGGLMVLLHTLSNRDPDYKRHRLTRALWKFDSIDLFKVERNRKRMEWYKLVLAGIMIACIIQTTSMRFFSIYGSIMASVVFFSLWVAFLHFYWLNYVIIIPPDVYNTKDSDNNNNNSTKTSKQSGVSPSNHIIDKALKSWSDRLKNTRESTEEDLRLPVSIVTGFLGSGKTTLIKHILHNTAGLKVLVIENEVGQEGVDHELLMQQVDKEDIVLMNNGCICCTGMLSMLCCAMISMLCYAMLCYAMLYLMGFAMCCSSPRPAVDFPPHVLQRGLRPAALRAHRDHGAGRPRPPHPVLLHGCRLPGAHAAGRGAYCRGR
ncbi:hypothetical protein EON64_14950 [archaeon]|nr:MAG: hypothetical protein EON64_14950 [archaeon]